MLIILYTNATDFNIIKLLNKEITFKKNIIIYYNKWKTNSKNHY